MKKTILLLFLTAFIFSACNRCVECTHDDLEYTVYAENSSYYGYEYETYGDRIMEVCSDNFESKKDFKNYIEAIEKYEDWECKSDFWN
jgi:hypothetical protein